MWGNMKIAFNNAWQYEFQFDDDENTLAITQTDITTQTYTITLSIEEARSLHSFLTSILNKGAL